MFKSAWITAPETISILDKKTPELGARDVQIKVKSCGICGTDIHYYRDFPGGSPLALGHEVAGVIESVGAEVRHLSPGDNVVVQNNIACGICEQCLNQNPQACTDILTYMDDYAGMAEYLTVPDLMAIKYDGLSHAEAALAEPLTVSLDLWREAAVSLGDDVLIIGPGIIGLGLIKLIEKSGARNIVVAGRNFDTTRGKIRKKTAESIGATRCIDTADTEWKNRVKEDYPAGFRKVVVTAPPALIPDGIELAGFGADIIYNGINFKDDILQISANELHFQKKHLKTSHAIPNWGFPIALDLLKTGEIKAELLLTDRFPLNQIEKAFDRAQAIDEPVIKVVVDF
ncbi:MAG: alcohol dehydrogenase catalytic domain-containing protein [Spirochaetales bacterium]|uniref:Alcohol dehydrogenase catalytic domain-containing protein n=1 Tax=Candidatus Thalassospirochaeta sargassi TaxID=3119039 RepID=A0AAJ1IAW8_9SPIO|nr:alcohol dehydrogenase catalytic domain-containing protein [Spirochaetales bacterium]